MGKRARANQEKASSYRSMENNEENKIQDAQVVPEVKLEEIVKEASTTTPETKAEEMSKEVLDKEAEEAHPETTSMADIDDL